MVASFPEFIYRNEGIFYPLLVAVSILLVTAVEHRHKLQDMATFLRHQVDYRKIAVELGCWSTFLLLGGWAYQTASDGDPSVLLTVGAALELFAFLLMWLPMGKGERGVDFRALGVSPRFCALLLVAFVLRLACTTQFQAYLPIDATGNWIYQALEAGTGLSCAAALAVWYRCSGPVPWEAPWAMVALSSLLCVLTSRHVYGDLAERPVYDQLYAASIYMETIGWLLQAAFVAQLPRFRINGNFLIPVTMHGVCRAYFWNLAYPEIAPQKPERMMELFPDAQVLCHYVIVLTCAAMCLVCLLKVPGVEEAAPVPVPVAAPSAPVTTPKPTPEPIAPEPKLPTLTPRPAAPVAAPKVAPAAPVATPKVSPAAQVAVPAPAPVAAAVPMMQPGLVQRKPPVRVSAPPVYPEMQGTLPAGCSHYVPVSAVVGKDGLVTVEYVAA